MIYSTDQHLKDVGLLLERLSILRGRADYDLSPFREFTSAAVADQAVQDVDKAIALLDQIDADPARRASAIASISP